MTDLRKLKDKASGFFSKGKFEKAAEAYDEYCKADVKDVQSRLRLGDAWAKAGVKDRAIVAYQWAAEGFAKDGFLPRAIAASKLVLELDPTHKGVQKMLADLYARKGGASKTARAAPGPAGSFDLGGSSPPPARKPAGAPSPTTRPDAIELPDYEVPSGEAGSTLGGLSAQGASSPSASRHAIAIEAEPSRPAGPRELTETELVLDTGAPMSGEVEVPIEGAGPAPRPSADPPGGEIVAEEPAPAPGYELDLEEAPADEPLAAAPAGGRGEVSSQLDEELAEPLDAPLGRAASARDKAPTPVSPSAQPTHPERSRGGPGLADGSTPLRGSIEASASVSAHPERSRGGPGLADGSTPLTGSNETRASVSAHPERSRGGPASADGSTPLTVNGALPGPTSIDPGLRVTTPAASRDSRPPAQGPGGEEPMLLTSRRRAGAPTPLPSAPDPLQPFASADSAPPGLRPKKAERPRAPAPAGDPRASPSASDLERSLQIFAEFDLESPRPPLVAAPEAPPPRSRDAAPPPSGSAPAPAAPPMAAPGSFTELELEGDTLFHAVAAAAARGLRQAGYDAATVAEEAMEAPEELRAEAGQLPRIPLFSDLPEDAFIALFERCPLRRKEPGELVVRQGSQGDSFFVICSGTVSVFREEGGKRHELATLGEGTFFGEMALLSDAKRTASVAAASEDTQLLEISGGILKELSEQHPTVAVALRKFYRQRLLTNLMNSAPIFRPFGKGDRRALVERFKAREVQPGEVLIREGTASDGLYVVLAGEVVVTVSGRPVAALKEGEVFGEMSLLTRTPGSATVASVRRTSLLRLPREDFDQLIMSHPQILEMVAELSDTRRKANAALRQKASATESMV